MRTAPQSDFAAQAVSHAKTPRYPGSANPLDLAQHLRPCVLGWFSAKTVALSALFTLGTGALTCAPAADDEEKGVVVDEKKVQEVVEKYLNALGEEVQVDAIEQHESPLSNNPPVYAAIRKEEHQQLIRGDMIARATDVASYIDAVAELFELYGLKIEKQFAYNNKGIQFLADGYDKDKRIGFELLSYTQESAEAQLDEIDALNAEIKKNNVNMLVIPVPPYDDPDISNRREMEAVLRSVVDYLEWLRTSGRL